LAFSRRQVLQPVDLDLNERVADLMKMLRLVIGKHIELNFIPGYNLGNIHADPGQIEQVLLNLCVNARDAMTQGGRITIETENEVIDSAFCDRHPWATAGQYVLLRVTDTGCGMDERTLDRIFEPFFTTKDEGKGTGLGLATVYGIVKQHDGFILVESEPEQGSRFKVYLPIIGRREAKAPEKPPMPALRGTETILLVEDEKAVRDLALRVLKEAGYTVLQAQNGEEAVQVFDAHADHIDLVLLDVVMPKRNGTSVHEHVLSVKPQTPVLFSSGDGVDAVREEFARGSSFHLLKKPYNSQQLLRNLRELLDSRG